MANLLARLNSWLKSFRVGTPEYNASVWNANERRILKKGGAQVQVFDDVVLIRSIHSSDIQLLAHYVDCMDESQWVASPNDVGGTYGFRHQLKAGSAMDIRTHEMMGRILDLYSFIYRQAKSVITGDSGYRLNRYLPGRGYYQHIDCHTQDNNYRSRYVSCIVQLNSDYEGGILEFPQKGLKFKLRAGDAVLFPSGHTHLHSVSPVTKGERINLVTWFT